jgi:segregation and condensation protein A
MASLVAASVSTYRQGIDLQNLVSNATWRELLVELVESNQLDPWDIDLAKMVDGYMSVLKEMRVLDLHVPANMMLAASILLRMKSDNIGIFPEPELQVEEQAAEQERLYPEIPALIPRLRMQPGRKITLSELMGALDDAIKVSGKREAIMRERYEPLLERLTLSKDDIDEKIDAAFGMVKRSADSEGVTTFARIANEFGNAESMLLDLFVPLLFLANMNRIMLVQEEFFDEIFISLNGNPDGGA